MGWIDPDDPFFSNRVNDEDWKKYQQAREPETTEPEQEPEQEPEE